MEVGPLKKTVVAPDPIEEPNPDRVYAPVVEPGQPQRQGAPVAPGQVPITVPGSPVTNPVRT